LESFSISFTDRDGLVSEREFDVNVEKIGINEGIHQIDLAPLSSFTKLKTLSLNYNRLQTIDLAPLRACTSLQEVYLSDNELQGIDMVPLSYCSNLLQINVSHNQLNSVTLCSNPSLLKLGLFDNRFRNIDLQPLIGCSNLQEIDFGANKLERIDLFPLSSCLSLKVLRLMSNKITSIDLSPLSTCTDLEAINLFENQLETIDLSPLMHCTNLTRLGLGKNLLEQIDLSPLSHCSEFKSLALDDNRLKHIDLSFLTTCLKFRNLWLHGNQLKDIDLSPLGYVENLKNLKLTANYLRDVDVTPLVLFERLNLEIAAHHLTTWLELDVFSLFCAPNLRFRIKYQSSNKDVSWHFLHKLAKLPSSNKMRNLRHLEFTYDEQQDVIRSIAGRAVQYEILRLLDLDRFGLVDIDLLDLMVQLPTQTDLGKVRQVLASAMLERICKQIDEGGTTIGIQIDKIIEVPELASRVDRIIELRAAEIRDTILPVDQYGPIGLFPLWTTAYGFEILRAAGFALEVDKDDISIINDKLLEVGLEVKVGTKETPDITNKMTTRMSNTLIQYIRWIADKRMITGC
jgi:Leucine-rich repeat (LRR) protein